ncbi:hypothetical protein [Galbitalea soli]|uniref:DUF7882 family protein n=1 Tax=Galbitalea soli TaxID=1268042 RepID=UPI001801F0EF|nr:hypothetical protein [Galbitalea soli]
MIAAKLRRREGFFLTWRDDGAVGDGRSSVWLHHSIPLYFRFSSAQRHAVNREWLDELSKAANHAGGLHLTEEPGRGSAAR